MEGGVKREKNRGADVLSQLGGLRDSEGLCVKVSLFVLTEWGGRTNGKTKVGS